MNFRDFLREVRKRFFSAVQGYNDQHTTREEHNPRGFNGNQINNKEQIAQAMTLLCQEIERNKVSANGLLKITRTFIAYAIDRSEVTVDKYLAILQKLGIIKTIEIGSHTFEKGKKAINCLYITLDMSWFTFEKVKETVQKAAKKVGQAVKQTVEYIFTPEPASTKIVMTGVRTTAPRLVHPAERRKKGIL